MRRNGASRPAMAVGIACMLSVFATGCAETLWEDLEVSGNRDAGPFEVYVVDAATGQAVAGADVRYRYFFADPVTGVWNKYNTLETDASGVAAIPCEANPPADGEASGTRPRDRNYLRLAVRVKAPGYAPATKTVDQKFCTSRGKLEIALEPPTLVPPVSEHPPAGTLQAEPVKTPPPGPPVPKEPTPKQEPPKEPAPKPEPPKEPVPTPEEPKEPAPKPGEPAKPETPTKPAPPVEAPAPDEGGA